MAFYVDSCVYLNLWQKEEGLDGKAFWRLALDFFDAVEKTKETIYFSGFVLKELFFILTKEEFDKNRGLFDDTSRFKRIHAKTEDYEMARQLETEAGFSISFFDCMHIVLTKKIGAVLVTRDHKLIEFAKKYCKVVRPEEAL